MEMRERPILFSGPMVRAILDERKTQTRRPFDPGWELGLDGGLQVAGQTPWATVWQNGVWHTWDGNGVGGCNSYEKTVELAKAEAMFAAFRQGFLRCPLGEVGDHLWVRETWAVDGYTAGGPARLHYQADGFTPKGTGRLVVPTTPLRLKNPVQGADGDTDGCWRPSIHMFRWASRLVLEITQVGIERLQDISMAAATSEGIYDTNLPPTRMIWCTARPELSAADRINHKDPTLGGNPYESFGKLWSTAYPEGWQSWKANPFVWVICFKIVEKKECL